MKLEMRDAPGQLVAALRPISEVGGNIIAVIHQRDEKATKGDTLSVQIVLELPDQRLSDLVRLIREQGVNIQRIGHERLLYEKTVIVIGHLIHTDLGDTVDRIDRTGFAEVTGLNICMPAITQVSSARLVVKAVNRQDMEQAMDILRGVSKEKNFLLVEPLEEIE
ncbi:MAG TPA: amino acid-binding protein [Methanolinea sp.]|jgi:ACT domain-containing protein|nr:amino acid-binding protein [Methanolinea sp.]HOS82531.1 amino acid-binding protein [Methanolinea sp.]HPC55043.1 amino acid-binding protein [Methanolinea sp.]HQE85529.1 amino acid-binding protein [Methanolinea sp.]HQI15029.1 amino acid-binding protein [Methanolinea sp.]